MLTGFFDIGDGSLTCTLIVISKSADRQWGPREAEALSDAQLFKKIRLTGL